MIVILSLSKIMNEHPRLITKEYSIPRYIEMSERLVGKLRKFSTESLAKMMARFIIEIRIESSEDLQAFDMDGYIFSSRISKKDELYFTR